MFICLIFPFISGMRIITHNHTHTHLCEFVDITHFQSEEHFFFVMLCQSKE